MEPDASTMSLEPSGGSGVAVAPGVGSAAPAPGVEVVGADGAEGDADVDGDAGDGPRAGALVAVTLLEQEASDVVSTWEELCRWDPWLPPENRPHMASEMVAAVAHALSRPQPLGWGADPEIEPLAVAFAVAAGCVDVAIGQLVCFREALRLHFQGRLPAHEELETLYRTGMVVDRAIGVAARHMAIRLEEQAFLDPLTGLLNRRALGRDLQREIGRAVRYDRSLNLMVADLDGLKAVNDTEGHAAGDVRLRAMATALTAALRVGDLAYRIGGDEFVVLMPEATAQVADAVAGRVAAAGAPAFTWGSASFPVDGRDDGTLFDLADRRLLAKRTERGKRNQARVPGR